MLYSIESGDDLESSNELVSLNNQIDELRLQDKLGKQNLYGKVKIYIYEPLTDIIKNTSENSTKTVTDTSFNNKKH